MIQKSLSRLVVLVFMFMFFSLLMAPGTTYAQEEGDVPLDLNDLKLVDQVDTINTFRAHLSIKVSGEAFQIEEMSADDVASIMINGEFIKNPAAQHIIFNMIQNGTSDEIEFIMVDGRSYTKIDGEWEEAASPLPTSDEVLDTAREVEKTDLPVLFESVGTETVNGRETVHYRIGKEKLVQATSNDVETQMILQNLEEAQFDMWIDQSEQFIVKIEAVIAGKGLNEQLPEASGRIEILLEFYDFNAPITITAPSTPQPEPANVPTGLPLTKAILEKAQEAQEK